MNFNKYYFLFIPLLTILLFSSCGESPPKGYKKASQGIYFQLHTIGDGVKNPSHGDYVTYKALYRTKEDSVLWSSWAEGKKGEKTLMYNKNITKGLNVGMLLLVAGDSASFIFEREMLLADQLDFPIEDTIKTIYVDVKVMSIKSEEQYNKEQEEYQEWLEDREMNEQVELLHYIEQNNIGKDAYKEGIYFIELEKGKGKYISTGDVVFVHYKGMFLDSTIFDSTYEMKEPFEFTFGDPDQIVDGLAIGLRLMNKGSKAKIIIPSQLAFGEEGSSTGIVPPYTTVVFDVEVVATR